MPKASILVILLALAGCAGVSARQAAASPCAVHEASYACQIERYHNVP